MRKQIICDTFRWTLMETREWKMLPSIYQYGDFVIHFTVILSLFSFLLFWFCDDVQTLDRMKTLRDLNPLSTLRQKKRPSNGGGLKESNSVNHKLTSQFPIWVAFYFSTTTIKEINHSISQIQVCLQSGLIGNIDTCISTHKHSEPNNGMHNTCESKCGKYSLANVIEPVEVRLSF